MARKRLTNLFLIFLIGIFIFVCGCSQNTNTITLNYFEYNRGKSFNTSADIRIKYNNSDFTFQDVSLKDESFFPDDSIFPNAFLAPLFNFDFDGALKAFTEPYYSYRLIHFFKKIPNFGIGLEFIHLKIFMDDENQIVRMTGIYNGSPIDQYVRVGDYMSRFNVSHGVNHASLYFVYRLMLLKSTKIKDGKLQPYINLSLGLTVPHLELDLVEAGVTVPKAYSYQTGNSNLGMGLGIGLRYKPLRNFGLNFEYKITYSYLNDMHFDDDPASKVMMDFLTGQLQWGISVMF